MSAVGKSGVKVVPPGPSAAANLNPHPDLHPHPHPHPPHHLPSDQATTVSSPVVGAVSGYVAFQPTASLLGLTTSVGSVRASSSAAAAAGGVDPVGVGVGESSPTTGTMMPPPREEAAIKRRNDNNNNNNNNNNDDDIRVDVDVSKPIETLTISDQDGPL